MKQRNGTSYQVQNQNEPSCSQRTSLWVKRQWRSAFTRKQLHRKMPIFEWLPHYNLEKAVSDVIAGITVGLTVIPQGIAYALIANMPPQYGLYSAFMGCFAYIIFGSSKDITVGPTVIMALLSTEMAAKSPSVVVLLTFLTGLIIMLLGFLQLGFVIDFISEPVTAGFTSAASIMIASGQIKSIFGLKIEHKSHLEGLEGVLKDVFDNIETIRLADSLLGVSCIILLLLMKNVNSSKWLKGIADAGCKSEFRRKVIAKCFWVISTARNAIVVITFSIVAYCLDPHLPDEPTRNTTFILTGNIQAGLPPFQLPEFSHNNTEMGLIQDFNELVAEMGSALILIPILAVLESVAIAKSFSCGKSVDASQEMIALGVCNFLGSFVSSMPVTGSFSRTAVNAASGVKTTMGGIYTGSLVILALAVLMPFCAYIPKPTLAAVIITAAICNVEIHILKPIWQTKKSDLMPAFITFLFCLFWGLEYGILCGIGTQVLGLLYKSARPRVNIELHQVDKNHDGCYYIYMELDGGILFPSVSFVKHKIDKAGLKEGESKWPLVLDCSHISDADFTAAQGFKKLIEDFKERNQILIFLHISPKVVDVFRGATSEPFIILNSFEEVHEFLKDLFIEGESMSIHEHPENVVIGADGS